MSLISVIEKDGKKIVSVLQLVTKDAVKVAAIAEKYLPEAAVLASILFPSEAAAIQAGTSVTIHVADLLQKSVVEVEQKASLLPSGLSGAEKSADVLSIVSATVISDLKSIGFTGDSSYVQSLIDSVVAILNIPKVAA